MNRRFICPPLSYTHRLYRYAYPDGIDNNMPFVETTATTVPEQIIEDSPAPNTVVAANALLHKGCDEPLFQPFRKKIAAQSQSMLHKKHVAIHTHPFLIGILYRDILS